MSMIEEIEKELHALEVGVASEVRGVRVVRSGIGGWSLYPPGSTDARGGGARWAAVAIGVAAGGAGENAWVIAVGDREWAATLLPRPATAPTPPEEQEGREADVEAVAKGDGREFNWRSAMRALSSEPLPPRLRTALVELGVHGHRLHVAVGAYGVRVTRAMNDPEERELPCRTHRDWPEHAERAEALRSYEEAREAVAAMARAWVEGLAVPEDYGTWASVPLRPGRAHRSRMTLSEEEAAERYACVDCGQILKDRRRPFKPSRFCSGVPESPDVILARIEARATGEGTALLSDVAIRNRPHGDAEYDPDPAASASYPGSDPGKWTTVETPRPAQPKSDGRDLALAIVDELREKFPGPCSAIRRAIDATPLTLSVTKEEAVAVVRSYLSSISLRQLSPALAERFRIASLTSPKPGESTS